MVYDKLEKRLGLKAGVISSIMSTDLSAQYDINFIWPKRRVLQNWGKPPKRRAVFAPHEPLKSVQRKIGKMVADRFVPHHIAHAYTEGRSIISNAESHLGCAAMLSIDFQDFFGSIQQPMVAAAVYGVLPEIPVDEIDLIAEICCRNGHLPQGSPASPVLSNLVCVPLDIQLYDLALTSGCAVGRFSDDSNFSTTADVLPERIVSVRNGEVELGAPLLSIIGKHGFVINWNKVRLQNSVTGIRVTGLNVGTRLTVPRKLRDGIRAALEPDPKDVERYQHVVIHAVFAKRWSGAWHGLVSPGASIAGRVCVIQAI